MLFVIWKEIIFFTEFKHLKFKNSYIFFVLFNCFIKGFKFVKSLIEIIVYKNHFLVYLLANWFLGQFKSQSKNALRQVQDGRWWWPEPGGRRMKVQLDRLQIHQWVQPLSGTRLDHPLKKIQRNIKSAENVCNENGYFTFLVSPDEPKSWTKEMDQSFFYIRFRGQS